MDELPQNALTLPFLSWNRLYMYMYERSLTSATCVLQSAYIVLSKAFRGFSVQFTIKVFCPHFLQQELVSHHLHLSTLLKSTLWSHIHYLLRTRKVLTHNVKWVKYHSGSQRMVWPIRCNEINKIRWGWEEDFSMQH